MLHHACIHPDVRAIIMRPSFWAEVEQLAEHGITLPPNMQGLTDEQIEELKLQDEWAEKCTPSGGHVFKKDDIGRRNGHGIAKLSFPCSFASSEFTRKWLSFVFHVIAAPQDNMAEVLKKTVKEAKDMISNVSAWHKAIIQCMVVSPLILLQKNVQMDKCMTFAVVQEALDILRGAVTIVYPMGLPPHDPIRAEFENTEDLSGTQVVINPFRALWSYAISDISYVLISGITGSDRTGQSCPLVGGKRVGSRQEIGWLCWEKWEN